MMISTYSKQTELLQDAAEWACEYGSITELTGRRSQAGMHMPSTTAGLKIRAAFEAKKASPARLCCVVACSSADSFDWFARLLHGCRQSMAVINPSQWSRSIQLIRIRFIKIPDFNESFC